MHPELFRIPLLDRPVPAYGMMLMVGFLLAIFFLRMRAASIGLDKGQVFDLGFCAIVGGIVGARLMHVIVFWPKYFLEKTF